MTNRFVRSSKFRHVFGTPYKKDNCYDNIKITKNANESNMSSVNKKFIAVALESRGGGAFFVAPLTKVGRFDINYPKVAGHKSPVLDLMWNPFNDNQIASSSEDCYIKIWDIPDGGISSNLEDPICTLEGHQKKVHQICWHPCASDILLSAGADNMIIVWNTLTREIVLEIGVHPDIISSVSFNYNGSHIATTCKDRKIRVINARNGEILSEGSGHLGNKISKVVFCGKMNRLFTTGFSRMSDRQYALWNPRDLSKAICTEIIDTGTGALFPFWDDCTKMAYVIGKGDTAIKYFEVTEEKVFFLSMYQSTKSQRGAASMPKRELDYMKCEVMRFYKLHPSGMVEPISMTVPRKSEMFQDDIFPPCPSGCAALTAEEWISGKDCDPRMLNFTKNGLEEMPAENTYVGLKPIVRSATAPSKEISVLKRLNSPPPGDAKAVPVTLEEFREAYLELLKENEELKAKVAELEGK